jgi:hypothetical protein
MQIYSFTPILMKFCTLDLQNNNPIDNGRENLHSIIRRKLLSTLILQKPAPTTIFNPVKKKRQFFRVGNTLTFAASPLVHPLSISSPSPLDTHKKQPLLSFLSLLSTKKVFSTWKSRLHDMFRSHSYIWLFIKVAISQNVFE